MRECGLSSDSGGAGQSESSGIVQAASKLALFGMKRSKTMEEKKKRIDLGLDNPVMTAAKQAMNSIMKLAVARAISTGSMEGTATLNIRFELEEDFDKKTGESFIRPKIEYKSRYAVPLKDSIDGKIMDPCRIIQTGEGFCMISNQISMDEIMQELGEES